MVVHKRRYEDGKAVYAKWPGSGYYYKAEIMDFHNEEDMYSVKFSEGDDSLYQIASKDMFAEKRGLKGKKEKKSRSRSRSRSRSTSRSRKSQRKRSTSKSPDKRLDRGRGRSLETHKKTLTDDELFEEADGIHKVPSEKFAAISNEENTPVEVMNHIAEIVTNNGVHKHFEQNMGIVNCEKTEEIISNQEWLSNSVTKKHDNVKKRSCIMSFFSIIFYIIHNCALLASCSLTLLLPLVFICGFYLACNEKNCSLLVVPAMPSMYNLLEKNYFVYVFGWYLLQAFIAALPFGRVAWGPGKEKVYRLNGVTGLFVSVMTIALLMYYDKFPMNIISEDYLSVIIAAYMFVLLTSTILLFVSQYSEEPSGGILQDFVYGRMHSPSFGILYDIKTAAFKAGFMSWAALNIVYLVNAWRGSLEPNVALILLVSFQLWYIFDHMVFEETNLYTSSPPSEKVGFTALSGMLMFLPLFSSFQARFLSLHPRSVHWNQHIAPVVLQVVGYLVYRLSVLEKFHFEKNPYKAKVSGAVYISTSSGKDILLNGWWGTVRHPNYLGDLLMNLSWALLCGFSHFTPWIWVMTLTVSLFCMARREDALCLKKYGKHWEEYQEEVKYRLLPFVY